VARLAPTTLVACLIAVFASVATARADAPLPPDYFGMNVNRVLFDDHEAWHTTPLAAAHAAGATHGRIDFPWDAVQPTGPRRTDYTWTDKAVESLARQGMVATPMLGYSAPWAAYIPGNTHSPPRNTSDYAAFARLMVLRYGPNGVYWKKHPFTPYLPIHRWEIWNEPNLARVFWQSGRSPDAYARLYLAARAVIKAVDPTAQVIVGGLSSEDIPFLAEMFTAHPELHGQVDGLGIHPYGATSEDVLVAVKNFRALLDVEGESAVPMEVTEVGWQRQGNTNLTVDELTRARDMNDVTNAVARSDCDIDAYEPYTWETAEQDPADGEDWFGMWSPTQGLLPSGQAFANSTVQYATPDERVAARSTNLLRICRPPAQPLSVRVQARGTRLRLQVRAGAKGVKSALVAVQSGSRKDALVTGNHGYVYYRPSRSATRVKITAAAYGFAGSRPVVHRISHKLPRR
jgi:hypothetical protein